MSEPSSSRCWSPPLGLGVRDTRIRVWNEPLLFGVGPGMLGRIYDSVGRPTDGGAPFAAVRRMRIDGLADQSGRARVAARFHRDRGLSASI